MHLLQFKNLYRDFGKGEDTLKSCIVLKYLLKIIILLWKFLNDIIRNFFSALYLLIDSLIVRKNISNGWERNSYGKLNKEMLIWSCLKAMNPTITSMIHLITSQTKHYNLNNKYLTEVHLKAVIREERSIITCDLKLVQSYDYLSGSCQEGKWKIQLN